MTIHVTQEDIDNGRRCSCYHCPIALAVSRTAEGSVPRVSEAGIRWGTLRMKHTKATRDFVRRFDDCMPVQPFTFELEAGK